MVTTIQIDKKVKVKLDKLKIHYRETYNELISRLLERIPTETDKESLIETINVLSDPETMKNIAEALKDYEKCRGVELRKLAKELDLNV